MTAATVSGISATARRNRRAFSDTGGVLGRVEHLVDYAAVVMDLAVEGGAEAVDKAHRAEARAPVSLAQHRCASMTRSKICSTALRICGSRSSYPRKRLGTERTHWRTGSGGKIFGFDTNSGKFLQDGTYKAPDGISIVERTEGDNGHRSGLSFGSRPANGKPPHLHVDDWDNCFGLPVGFSSHRDVSFPGRNTQQMLDSGKVGEVYLLDIKSEPGQTGRPLVATAVTRDGQHILRLHGSPAGCAMVDLAPVAWPVAPWVRTVCNRPRATADGAIC